MRTRRMNINGLTMTAVMSPVSRVADHQYVAVWVGDLELSPRGEERMSDGSGVDPGLDHHVAKSRDVRRVDVEQDVPLVALEGPVGLGHHQPRAAGNEGRPHGLGAAFGSVRVFNRETELLVELH